MIILIPILFFSLVIAVRCFRKKRRAIHLSPFEPTTPKEAYRAYYAKYDPMMNPKHYNRLAFRLVNDAPIFLDDNPYTSAYLYPAVREMLTVKDEVYCMIVVQSSKFGYVSHSKKQAKRAILLLFHAEPFRELGGSEFKLSWRVDHLNYHVVDNRIMKCEQIEDFVKQAIGEYEFEETQ